ncbi:uncharacterized protein LOC117785626 isoform X1 [Drosophila innubila]|uniref:uncharacterized protein LOC117785626 isoform X1 n=1 Tax=Drosophila innubila TaxID=198719 RepID=UPI00148C3A53|nr:uncharacterized protein LOC117785626 isoform X1 [Drosophila innubila]
MSGEIYQIETRRRSRSKTPFLRSSCDHENCEHAGEEGHVHHKKKKPSMAPNVQTIVEEHVVETHTSSSSTINRNSNNKATRSKGFAQLTSDYSSDYDTPEGKRKGAASSTKSTVTTMFTNTSKRLGNALSSLTAATSTPRSQLETTQNVLNSAQEQRSSKRSNGDANLSQDHIAYIEYRDAGEYWNKTPKTDYTYSELSPHRRQLAPGIVAMPNMSRRSLANHDERVEFMVQQNPAQEEFIRRRYQAKLTHLNYDSSDEVDITHFGQQQKQSWWLLRFISFIVSNVSSTWTRLTSISNTETNAYHNYYANQQRQQQHGILASSLLSLYRYLYVGIASVLSLDTWLLKSGNTENKSKKRFLIFLLILLPLLLLAGLFYYLHPNETFPPSTLNLNTFTLPELPKLDFGAYLNSAQYESWRSQAVDQAVRLRDWADDYLLYLQKIGQNVANKGRQLFQANNEQYYERL